MGKKKHRKSNIDSVLKVIHGADKKKKKSSKNEFNDDINAMLGFETEKKSKHKESGNDVEDILTQAVADAIEVIGGEPVDTLLIIMENLNNIMEFLLNEYVIGDTVRDNGSIKPPATIKHCEFVPMSATLLLTDNRAVDIDSVHHETIRYATSNFDSNIVDMDHSFTPSTNLVDQYNEDEDEESVSELYSSKEVSEYLSDNDDDNGIEAVFNSDEEPKMVQKSPVIDDPVEEKAESDGDGIDGIVDTDVDVNLMDVPKVDLSSKYGEFHETTNIDNIPVLKKKKETAVTPSTDNVFVKNRKEKPL